MGPELYTALDQDGLSGVDTVHSTQLRDLLARMVPQTNEAMLMSSCLISLQMLTTPQSTRNNRISATSTDETSSSTRYGSSLFSLGSHSLGTPSIQTLGIPRQNILLQTFSLIVLNVNSYRQGLPEAQFGTQVLMKYLHYTSLPRLPQVRVPSISIRLPLRGPVKYGSRRPPDPGGASRKNIIQCIFQTRFWQMLAIPSFMTGF